jgi:hypothetical protein
MSNPEESISKMQIFKTECEFQILFYDAIKLPFCATLSNKENCSGSNNVMDMYIQLSNSKCILFIDLYRKILANIMV